MTEKQKVMFGVYILIDYLYSLLILVGFLCLLSPLFYIIYSHIGDKLSGDDYRLLISMFISLQISLYLGDGIKDGIEYAKEKIQLNLKEE